jgi:hypothetical protein
MLAVESIGDSLDWEGQAIKRQSAADHEAIYGTEGTAAETETSDMGEEMRKTLIAGDAHYHYSSPNGKQPAVTTTTATASKPRVSTDDLKAYIKKKIAEGIAASQPKTVAAETTAEPWYKRFAVPIAVGAAVTGAGGTAAYNAVTKPAETPVAVVQQQPTPQPTYNFDISTLPGHGISAE